MKPDQIINTRKLAKASNSPRSSDSSEVKRDDKGERGHLSATFRCKVTLPSPFPLTNASGHDILTVVSYFHAWSVMQ